MLLSPVVEAFADRGQHPQHQHIDLQNAERIEIGWSHSLIVRSAIVAFSIGTISHSKPFVSTLPPVCCGCRSRCEASKRLAPNW